MNKYKKYILAGAATCLMLVQTGCNDSFLERYPIVSISPEAFFKNITDLELYTNTYTLSPSYSGSRIPPTPSPAPAERA